MFNLNAFTELLWKQSIGSCIAISIFFLLSPVCFSSEVQWIAEVCCVDTHPALS